MEWGGEGFLYTCDVNDWDVDSQQNITSINGKHENEQQNINVKAFRIKHANSIYAPNGIGNIFPNLVTLQIMISQVKYISIDSFAGFKCIKGINFWNNNIREINENTFNKVPTTEAIYLSENLIEVIHRGTFRNLKSLQLVEMQGNKIKSLAIGLFNYNLVLKTLNMESNSCIDKKAMNSSQVNSLVEEMFKCYNNYETDTALKLDKCNQKLSNVTNEVITNSTNHQFCETKNSILHHWLFNLFFGFWDF